MGGIETSGAVRRGCGALAPPLTAAALVAALLLSVPAVTLGGSALGVSLLQERRFAQAIEAFTQAIADRPGAPENYNNRGVCRFFIGDLDGAVADYTRAVTLNPMYAEAYKNRGGAWFYRQDYPKAVDDYTRALEIAPSDAETHYHRGIARYYQGQYRESIEDHARALKLRPDFAAAANQIAWTLATCPDPEVRDGEKAVAMAREAMGMASDSIAMDTLAAAYAEAGRFEDAAALQEKVIALLEENGASDGRHEAFERLDAYRGRRPWRDAVPELCGSRGVADFVERWRRAWEGADLAGYLACYHPNARQGDLSGKIAIGDHKKSIWPDKAPSRVVLGDLTLDPAGDGCRVTFSQEYENRSAYRDKGVKTLDLTAYGGTFLIVEENWRSR